MIIPDKILVTAVRRFQGDVDGTVHNFTKITYTSLNSSVKKDTEIGSFPKECVAGDYKAFDDFSKVSLPAVFDANFLIEETRKGISKILQDYTFVKSLDFK